MLIEVKIYGRGGQGAVTAANILALAAYFDGLWSQSIPFFGAERRGAPVVSIVRISDKPIRIHHIVNKPDVAVVFDHRLLSQMDIELKDGESRFILNFKNGKKLSFPYSTYVLDATSIAIELGMISSGMPIVNTAMLGAIAKAGIVSLNSIVKAVEKHWHGALAKKNVEAVNLGYLRTSKIR